MNSRDYKIFRAGQYYHVFNRGVNRQPIFLDEQDYFNFLKRVKIVLGLIPIPNKGSRGALRLTPLPPFSFEIHSYCLMPNHFHFLIKQVSKVPIGNFVHKVSNSYAKYFNRKYERVGNVFQDTFKAKIVDNDSYLKYLSAYIHNNPNDPLAYPYSSFADYIMNRNGQITHSKFILGFFQNNKEVYKKFVLNFNEKQTTVIKDYIFEE